jgi:bacteriorhodopsin
LSRICIMTLTDTLKKFTTIISKKDVKVSKEGFTDKITDKSVKNTFYITYVFFLTTATITFIEAMRTTDIKARHILNLETAISVIAAYFYGTFIEKIKNKEVNYKEINETRYLDWSMTTPVMLLVLVLAFLYNTGGSLRLGTYAIILVLNSIMLGTGYLGEIGTISKNTGFGVGFTAFFTMFYYIYAMFLKGKYKFDNSLLYWAFFILWSMYGLLYMMDEKTKNVGFNILDLFAKCFVGIFFWAYFTKVITL